MYISPVYAVIYYSTERGDRPVLEFLDNLDKKSRAKVMAHIDLLAQYGPDLKRPYADHVRRKIRELRVQMGSKKYRILHFFFFEGRIVLLHSLLKTTPKLKESDIALAESRMADWIARHPRGG
ncbi:MAG: hypothetical protein A3G34_16940 [Candidatus Lindowbacteria bacterium RIFCSPLOWO2_12_FULL_62_27]|nr:MAG: hypothetical protein A3G34_16940 [Candidatus Lindowbacteria bacterium RIFCSPLOWO2_12_FULL_62_27]OGH63948.1 MAG: hypothetical protein A3I06_10295 [Candidatus Lindowbacteria bacterium RIFCSPLOWO2_02_FULL_62_12]